MRFLILLVIAIILSACATQTGQIGEPVAASHKKELDQITIGRTTPSELNRIFKGKASLKEKGAGYEIWEVAKPGNLDVGSFLMWGEIAHDKDQSLLFRFEGGKLASYRSAVTN